MKRQVGRHVPIFQKHGRRIAFIHIPKVAGSSIETLFKNHGWEMEFHARHYDAYVPSPQHLTYEALREQVPDLDSLISFAVVRDPMARVRSEWQYQFSILKATLLDFPDFIRHMEASLSVSKTYWDNHWRPQSDFLSDELDRVFCLEELSRELPNFLDEHDIIRNGEVPHSNRSRRGSNRFMKLYRVDQATADRIKRIYRSDYERFGEFGYDTDGIRLT